MALSRGIGRYAIICLSLLITIPALADTSKISPDLLPLLGTPGATHNVIIQYNSPPQTCTSGGLLGGLLCTTVNLLGGVVHTVFDVINAVTGTLTGTQILSMSDQANVSYISLDRSVHGTLDYATA